MKAFVTAQSGGSAIELVDVPIPGIDDNEMLIRLRAIGVGIHDSYFLPPEAPDPYPIGIEGAGVIEKAGNSQMQDLVGERVAFVSMMQPKGGTWAEYAAVAAQSLILPIPADVDFTQAAAIPIAGNTTLKAMAGLSELPDGASVFIAGGAGAIGTMAIQVARQHRWRVAASASTHNHRYMQSLGAEITVDYHDPQWPAHIRQWMPSGVDAAIAIHPDTTADSMQVVKDAGKVITISGDRVGSQCAIQVAAPGYQTDVREGLTQLMGDVGNKKVHLEIEHVYPFDQAAEALARVQTRHVRGKLVLHVP